MLLLIEFPLSEAIQHYCDSHKIRMSYDHNKGILALEINLLVFLIAISLVSVVLFEKVDNNIDKGSMKNY
jgi:hypothetical protein